ncbi:MAG: hypothetical protein ACXAB4_03615, partial [Candidatus Hodarchaeales archaeon]
QHHRVSLMVPELHHRSVNPVEFIGSGARCDTWLRQTDHLVRSICLRYVPIRCYSSFNFVLFIFDLSERFMLLGGKLLNRSHYSNLFSSPLRKVRIAPFILC